MPVSENIKKVVQEPNKRIAIFGKFRREDDFKRHVFGKEADEDKGTHKLNGRSFIDVIKPELCMTKASDPKHQFKIGDIFFQGFHLKTPALDDGSVYAEGVPILYKSLLFDQLEEPGGSGDPGQQIQETGGQLFKDLIKHLDVSSRFGHSNFVKALSWILEIYVPFNADQVLTSWDEKHTIDIGIFQKKLREDTTLRGEMIKYLLCLEDDEMSVEGSLKGMLKKWAGESPTPFATDDDTAQARQINQIVEIVGKLKHGLMSESTELSKFLQSQGAGWFDDIAVGDFNFAGPETGKGRSFFGYFKTCKESSDWLGRFLRNDVMHSYLFCFLASKYKSHPRAQFPGAAEKMFKFGIQEQTDRFVFESRAERAKRMSTVDKERKAMAKEFTKEMNPHIDIVASVIKQLFLPKNGFTREQLEERAIEMFILNCQIASGQKIKQLHAETKKYVAELNRGYQPVLRYIMEKGRELEISDEDKIVLNISEIKEVLSGLGGEVDAFSKELFDEIGTKESISAAEFKDLHVQRLTRHGLSSFRDGYKDAEEEINKERAKIEALGRARLGLERKSKGGITGFGTYLNIVDLETLAEDQKEGVNKKIQNKKRAASMQQEGSAQTSIKMPLSVDSRKEALSEGKSGQMYVVNDDGNDVAVATVSVEEDQLVIERSADTEAVKEGKSDPKEWKVVFPGEEEEDNVLFVHEIGDLDVLKVFPELQEDYQDIMSEYNETAGYLDACHDVYVGGRDANFQKTMRARVLAETILSIPRGNVNLDSENLNNVIGVIMEMVEHLGDPGLPVYGKDALKEGDETFELLKQINLSEFFPLPDSESHQMSTVLQYHYSLCENLQNVKRYIEEIKELRDYFESVKNSDLEVQFYNVTFDEYPGIDPSRARAKDHVFLKDPPLVIYATAQSNPDSLSNCYNQFQKWLSRGKTAWKTEETAALQAPVVVMHPGYDKTSQDVGWPVFTSASVSLPELGKDFWDVDYAIQRQPYLLWATALCERGPYDFGDTPKDFMPPEFLMDDLREKKLPEWGNRESVYDYLKKCWLKRPDWLNQVLLIKWINFALAQEDKEFMPGADREKNNLAHHLRKWYDQESTDYQHPFKDLICGEKKYGDIKAEDPERPGFGDIFAGNQVAPIPKGRFKVDGNEIPADWTSKLEPK
jgi:hypothetical protein